MKTNDKNKRYESADGPNIIVNVSNPDGLSVEEMAGLIEKEVEDKGFLGIPIFSVKGLESFAAAFNLVYAKKQYRHTIVMFGGLPITAAIVYGDEIWNDREKLAFVKHVVTTATLDLHKSLSSNY